ncbi:Baculoviral IAP repeat-containing protein 1 [Myotis davidii]|uniref:Baculoviral IAP repeat-containing protein 1 n=1 Tax=Myotis davidii TaxID=225400 RepID=L5M0E5_MYODS|nr:Baculoviral IAP repeat-containing protein 1 [Myotis davidii]
MSLPQSASFGDWDPGFEFATCLQPGGLEGVTNYRSSSSAAENRTVVTRACLTALAGIRPEDQLPGVGVGAGRSCWQMRHLYVVVDGSRTMEDQDLKPNRLTCTLKLLEYFVEEYFDQNPISQIGIIVTKSKRAEKLTELSGTYHVILDESHYKELLTHHVSPPPASSSSECSLIRMGPTQHLYSGRPFSFHWIETLAKSLEMWVDGQIANQLSNLDKGRGHIKHLKMASQEEAANQRISQYDETTIPQLSALLGIDMVQFVKEIDKKEQEDREKMQKGFNSEMRSEAKRLKTFVTYDSYSSWTPQEMAAAGFYFTGIKSGVQCFCCSLILFCTTLKRLPIEHHKKFSPHCEFLLGKDVGNIAKYDIRVKNPESKMRGDKAKYQEEKARLESFHDWPFYAHGTSPPELSAAGFVFTGKRDTVQCFSCGGCLGNWEEGDDPWKEHAKWFPKCEFLQRKKSSEEISQYIQSYKGFVDVTGEHFVNSWVKRDLPMASAFCNDSIFANEELRQESFKKWPHASPGGAALAKAGLFYIGIEDIVQCFSCGGCMNNWVEDDDPLGDHSKYFPDCLFLQNLKASAEVIPDLQSHDELSELAETISETSLEDSAAVSSLVQETAQSEAQWFGEAKSLNQRLKEAYTDASFRRMYMLEVSSSLATDHLLSCDLSLASKHISTPVQKPVVLSDVFANLNSVMCVEGEAGSGKTVLLKKIALLWASGCCPLLNRFQLVFYLSLSSTRLDQGLANIICDQLLETEGSVTEMSLRIIMQQLKNQVLFLLDDYKEMCSVPQVIQKLIHKNHSSRTCLLIAVRTNRTRDIRQHLHTILEIKPFPFYNTVYILRKFFSHDLTRLQKFMIHFKMNENLQGIQKTPLFVAAVCANWFRNPFDRSYDHVTVFKSYIECLSLKHKLSAERFKANVSSCESLLLLRSIRVSVTGNMKIMSPVPDSSCLERCWDKSQAPTIQQDCAAAFEDMMEWERNVVEKQKDILRFMSMIVKAPPDISTGYWKLSPKQHKIPLLEVHVTNMDGVDQEMLRVLMAVFSASQHIELHLRGSRGFIESLRPAIEQYKASFTKCSINESELNAVEQELLLNLPSLESLEVSGTTQIPDQLFPNLDKFPCLKELSVNMDKKNVFSVIPEEFLKLHNMEKLLIEISAENGPSKIVKLIENSPNLNVFHLQCNFFSDFESLLTVLASCKKLKEIKFSGAFFKPIPFVTILTNFISLKILDLKFQEFPHKETSEKFAHTLGSLSSLEELILPNGDGIHQVAKLIIQQCQHLRCLRVLSFFKTLNDDSVMEIAKVAISGGFQKLENLDLSLNHKITEEGYRNFFQVLDNLPNLQELTISRHYTECIRAQATTVKSLSQCMLRLPSLTTIDMLGWLLDAEDITLLTATKEKHPQSKLFNIHWKWRLPFSPIIQE